MQFFDKKRRKSGWLTGIGRGNDEEVIWEEWLVEVTIARPKTEGGKPGKLHVAQKCSREVADI